MNSERDSRQCEQASGRPLGQLVLQPPQIEAIRELLHELANVLTGVMIAGGLMVETLQQTPLGASASTLYGDCERGRRLVWELRTVLSEAGAGPHSKTLRSSAAANVEGQPVEPQAQSRADAAGGAGEDHNRRRG
jgi:hypothetical protein